MTTSERTIILDDDDLAEIDDWGNTPESGHDLRTLAGSDLSCLSGHLRRLARPNPKP